MYFFHMILSCVLAFVLLPALAFSEPNTEVASMRTQNAKTFLNQNGTYTTHVYQRPIHEKDASGNWVDITWNGSGIGAAKVANFDTFRVDYGAGGYPFLCVGRTDAGVYSFCDDDNGGDDDFNLVGYQLDKAGEPYRTYRQMFRWFNFSFFPVFDTIVISDMRYSFNNVYTHTSPDIMEISSVVDTDPLTWSASSIWQNGTRQPFTSVTVTRGDSAKAYVVDLADDITTLEDRVNSYYYKDQDHRDELWYAVHHMLQTESSSHWMDICAAWAEGAERGYLAITWTTSSPKIALSNRITVQAIPNPFNPGTTLSFTLGKPDHVTLDVFSITGQKVFTLVDCHLSAGRHRYAFDGSRLSSGLYFYRLMTSQGVEHGKCMLLK